MKRLILFSVVAVVAVVVASACPSETSHGQCGEPAAVNLTNCDLVSLGAIQPGGIWNTDVQWQGGTFVLGAFNLVDPAGETISTQPVTDKQVSGNQYFRATTYERNGHTYKLAFSGCGATDATHFGGIVQFCVDDLGASQGLFRAARLSRLPGEAESSHLTMVSETRLTAGTAADVFVSNGYAYVSALYNGVEIFDVRDPAHPTSVARIDPAGDYWNSAWVKDNVLYIASANAGVILYDIANPAAPTKLGTTPGDKPHVHTLSLNGDRLYAASPSPRGEVLVYDVSTAYAPMLLSRFKAVESEPAAGAWPASAVALNDKLYVAHRALGYVVANLNMADGGAPQQIGSFEYPGVLSSQATAVGVIGDKTIAFEAGEDWDAHLRVLDVTNPSSIAKIGELKLRPEVSIHNLALVGTKLYVAYYQEGLRVIDVSDPANPSQVGYYNTWRESDPNRGRSFFDGVLGVRVPGDGHIYVTESSRGLMIFDES